MTSVSVALSPGARVYDIEAAASVFTTFVKIEDVPTAPVAENWLNKAAASFPVAKLAE